MNYQFLNTFSIRAEEFRPADLPDGWDHSPEKDRRHWLTEQTEAAYYHFCADRQFRQDYFLRALRRRGLLRREKDRDYLLAAVLEKNPRFLAEPVYADVLDGMAKRIVKQYGVGRLIVAGDNRYLSGDLLDFLVLLLDPHGMHTHRQRTFWAQAMTNEFPEAAFYAPGAVYDRGGTCTLLRDPHIARNEELQLSCYDDRNNMRKYYLEHLTDVVMVNAFMLAAERLGGADYDGDMVKTIADPILNECVRRNYDLYHLEKYRSLTNYENIPLLIIPTEEPQIRDAKDWRARFETVRNTFSSRVGQICNAALDRSIVVYNENSDAEERQRCREETGTLAILVGLEIDAAKSGVRPDLDEYLERRTVPRTPFLQYKNLVERSEERRAWYEPTHAQRLESFFRSVDWESVDANVERLPYLARQLEKHTPKIRDRRAEDRELFVFAQNADWKKRLDRAILDRTAALLTDYEQCLERIRLYRLPVADKPKKRDIARILYARGQEEVYDADELYARFQEIEPRRIAALRRAVQDEAWHFMDEETRERFLLEWLPEFADVFDLLEDFRQGGCRVLGDLVCDIDDQNTSLEQRRLFREGDSAAFTAMMEAYTGKALSRPYREAVAAKCRELLDEIVGPELAVRYVVALGKRDLLWDLLLDKLERNVLEVRDAE